MDGTEDNEVILISSDTDSQGNSPVTANVFTPTKRRPSSSSSCEDNDSEVELEQLEPSIPSVKFHQSSMVDVAGPSRQECPSTFNPSRILTSSQELWKLEPSCKKRLRMSEISSHKQQVHFKDDKELPVFSKTAVGYGFDQLVEILMSPKTEMKVCSVRPCGVSENATFIIDLDAVRFSDLKSDDLGSWNATGTKSTFFYITDAGIKVSERKPSKEAKGAYYALTRRYYVHNTYSLFHRLIADVKDNNGAQNKFALLQYCFEGPEREVMVKPHGNAKSATPYVRTSDSAKERIRQIASSETPKSAIFSITREMGGEVDAATPSELPRNRQQISNIRRSHSTHDKNVLYSVMLECKLAQGSSNAFVRDVKAAPSPQCVLFFDWQLHDMERFLTNNCHFGILTVDTTFNLGDFYVTVITYPHLMVQDVNTGKHPSMVGPVLIHQQTDFSSFNYFAATVISGSKQLQNVLCFGTDGDRALIEAFSHNFPYAMQLRCFLHLKKNVQEKLRSLEFPSSVAEEVLADIFGKHVGSVYKEGLVDCSCEAAFDYMLEHLKSIWDDYELPFCPASGPRFHTYFARHQADVVKYHMRRDLREAVGLGSPPSIFTTNCSESINALLKTKVDYKQCEWPKFNLKLNQLVEGQRDEIIRALSGRGQYRLCDKFQYLSTSVLEWSKMRPDQRKELISNFDSVSLQKEKKVEKATATSLHKTMSIDAEDSGISTIPLITLQSMWDKAAKLLAMRNGITAAPGEDEHAKMVTSFSSKTPHYVCSRNKGQYVCDSGCIHYNSAKICSHTLAVAETNGELEQFLQWYTSAGPSIPNYTILGMEGLPKGRAGQKGGRCKRRRSTKNESKPEHLMTIAHCSTTSGASTSQINCSVVLLSARGPPPLISIGSSSPTICASPPNVSVSPPNVSASPPNVSVCPPNVNPFYLKFVRGNMRVCQGCRGSLKASDNSIPNPPFDVALARSEKRTFRDSNGDLITPKRPTICHYHCKVECVKAVEPDFIPSSIRVPEDIKLQLSDSHKEYLCKYFLLILQ